MSADAIETPKRAAPLAWTAEAFPGRPAYDVAVSRALLRDVAHGKRPETLRLYRPDDVVAFSTTDLRRDDFSGAVRAARRAGFDATLRLAGGSAAVFARETLAFAWCMPDPEPRARIRQRFARVADAIARALRRLGVDARVGEVAGEYCPGEFSVNARGTRKLMGVGQRIVRGAAHVGGVLVVGESARVRDVLVPVYEALDLPFDPATTGAVEDEIGPIPVAEVRDALLAEIASMRGLWEAPLPAETLAGALAFEGSHRVPEATDAAD
jgi:lipoate-protein ligase A